MKKPLQKTAGFTLIEIMISLVLLIVISTMLSDVFSGSSNAITTANRKSDNALQARVALNLIANELEDALISTNLQLSTLSNGEDVRFFSTTSLFSHQSATTNRSFMPVNYFNVTNTLYRWYVNPDELDDIKNDYIGKEWMANTPPTTGNEDVLVDYVTQFEVRINGAAAYQYGPGITNDPPLYADIVLGVLGEEDARTAGELNVSTDWIEQRENLFTTRIYFRNTPLEE